MMSFVENLRMRNMFPINSNMGSAEIDLSGADPMEEIIQRALQLRQSQQRPNGLQQVARQVMPQQRQQPMNVVSVGQSNPGAEMARSARAQGDRIYDSYNQPQITAGEVLHDAGMKPNEQFPGFKEDLANSIKNDDPDVQLSRDLKRSQIKSTDALTNSRSNPNSKVINIADPEDPTKQISVNYDSRTGTITPVQLGDKTVQPGAAAKTNLAEQEKGTKKNESRENQKTKATESLALIDELMDEKGKLKPDTEWITGWSNNFGTERTPKGAAAKAKIDQLRNNLTLDLIRDMKEQSKTGATGFGALNLKELGVLENAASKLDARNMEEGEYAKELGKIKERLNLLLQDSKDDSPTTPETPKTNKTTAPEAPEGYEYVRRPDNKGWTAIKKVGK